MNEAGPSTGPEQQLQNTSEDNLRTVVKDPALTEDLALAVLGRRDLSASLLQELANNKAVLKYHKVLGALISHPHTPRFVSLPMIRSLHSFEMLNLSLQTAVPADVKIAIEQALLDRVDKLSLGERITLAKRGSTRIAGFLLRDAESNVVELALQNPYLTEACIVRTLMSEESASVDFVRRIAAHPKWSLRTDVRCALLRNPNTPLGVALELAQTLPADIARDALFHSNLPAGVKTYLMSEIQNRLR